jgi:hypothetical protein
MLLFKSIPFTFENKDYAIKVFYNDTVINILAFHNNYPVNGFRHQIKISKNLSVKELLKRKIMDEIIEIARKDIFEKRWERLLQVPTTI